MVWWFWKGLTVVLILGAIAGAILIFARLIPFNASDVRVTIDAPRELDIGGEADVFVTVENGTRATLRSGTIALDVPEAIEVITAEQLEFETLEFRGQTTAKFRIRTKGDPGAEEAIRARVRFRPRQLSAVFEKQARATIVLRDLPFSARFSFSADIQTATPTTFFLDIESDTRSRIGPVGVTLAVPESFAVTRTNPEHVRQEDVLLWDFDDVDQDFSERIAVTGTFDVIAEAGTFTARVGLLNGERTKLEAYREVEDTVRLRTGEIRVDVNVNDVPDPFEAPVEAGSTVRYTIEYRNTTPDPVHDVSVVLAAAHPLILQRNVEASEPYTRSVSGEYVWSAPAFAALSRLDPGEEGAITIQFPMEQIPELETIADTNQAIPTRARVLSGGRILGERQVTLKLVGQLKVAASVRYFRAPGGSNKGPLPPVVGEETTYTVDLSVTGGTSGIEGTTARIVLGDGVRYLGPVDPTDPLQNRVGYAASTREVLWNIGVLQAGAGVLSAPARYVFRIGFVPTDTMVGSVPVILETVVASGNDTFAGRMLDASDKPVDAELRSDSDVSTAFGRVKAAN